MASTATSDITERIRQASDIVDVIAGHVTLKHAGRSIKGLCPFHSEKTPSFTVSPERQTFKCFGCGVGGDVFKFIQLREGVDFLGARAILAARAGIDLAKAEPSRQRSGEVSKVDLERVNNWAARFFTQQLASTSGAGAREYLVTRGINEESISKFALGFAPDGWQTLTQAAAKQGIGPDLLTVSGLCKRREDGSLYDAYRNRLMFPIQDALGRTIGFGGRTLGDDDAKYINSPQSALFDKSRCLYGLPHARDSFRQSGSAVVVEGYIDCLMAHQYGFGSAVATLGTSLTGEHVQLLRRFVESVTVVFDSDEAGKRAADQALPLFVQGAVDVKLAVVREAKDPAELLQTQGAKAFEVALTSAVGALELKWQQVMRHCRDDATGPRRRRAVEELLGLLAGSSEFGACDPIQRGLIVNQLGKLLGLASEEVNRQLRALTRRSATVSSRAASTVKPVSASSRDAAGAAMRELIEVLLNEPSSFSEIAPVFDPSLCTDETLRQIAQAIVELHDEESGIDLVRLISRFESVEVSSQITDLQASGERRGNYQATVAGATNRLMRLAEQSRIEEMSFVLRSRELGELGQGEIASKSLERTDALRRMNHFAARKHLGAPTSAGVALDGPNAAG